MPSTPIQLGQLFISFAELKAAIEDWAIADKFEIRVQVKDRTRADYRCKTLTCLWRVYARATPIDDIKVSILVSAHTCIGEASFSRAVQNTQSWLRREIPKHLNVTKRTTVQEVIDSVQIHHQVQVNYQAAHEALSALTNNALDYEQNSYHRLPAYIDKLREANPDVYVHLQSIHDEGVTRFQRIFISPHQARLSFQHCRRFIAVDGTFCKSRFVQSLLAAVTIDADGHILVLAWAVVESENQESWLYFMSHLKQAIPLIMEGSTIISDRNKGLMIAIDSLGPGVFPAHCCFHLRDNFKTRFGTRVTECYFSKIANAKSEEQYHQHMNSLRAEKPIAADYLSAIDKHLWVTAFFQGCRYGHNTSNIVESFNKSIKVERELSVLDLLNEIWHSQMAQRFKRKREADAYALGYTKQCLTEAETSRIWAQSNTVRMAGIHGGEVQQRANREGNRTTHIVNLDTRKCTCLLYQENGIPCSHAWACILAIQQAPVNYFPPALSTATWSATYRENWNPVSIEPEDLAFNPVFFPPVTRRQPGRPKKKRAERGDRGIAALNYARRANGEEIPAGTKQKCGTCKESGHNSRSCKNSHS